MSVEVEQVLKQAALAELCEKLGPFLRRRGWVATPQEGGHEELYAHEDSTLTLVVPRSVDAPLVEQNMDTALAVLSDRLGMAIPALVDAVMQEDAEPLAAVSRIVEINHGPDVDHNELQAIQHWLAHLDVAYRVVPDEAADSVMVTLGHKTLYGLREFAPAVLNGELIAWAVRRPA